MQGFTLEIKYLFSYQLTMEFQHIKHHKKASTKVICRELTSD